MQILEPRPATPGLNIENPREDYQSSIRAGQYRAGAQAIYYPGFPATLYVPYRVLTEVLVRDSALPTTGCCGKELPVIKLVLRWEGGEDQLVIDPPKHTDTLLNQILAARPDVKLDDRRKK